MIAISWIHIPVASKLGLRPQTVSPRRHISSHEITQSFPIFCLYLFRSDSVIYNYSNQATLDSSALKVYDSLISQLGESKNKKVQKAAKLNALMFARFAQNMAKVISRVKQKPYTAEDFLRERLKVDVNAVYNEELEDAAQTGYNLHQSMYMHRSNSLADFAEYAVTYAEASKDEPFYRIYNKDSTEYIDIAWNTIKNHIQIGAHPLTRNQWNFIEENLFNIITAGKSKKNGVGMTCPRFMYHGEI